MRFAYYPGCTSKGSTREAHLATQWLASKTGVELEELVDAGCCGSCEVKAVNPALHFMLNARILSMAAARDLEILTICDTCQANLRETGRKLTAETPARTALVEKLKSAGVAYGDTPRVRHFASILAEEFGAAALSRHVIRPLTGLRVAPFACCHAFRGPGATPGSRTILDELVALSGATSVPVRIDSDCCGFHILMVNEAASARTSARFLTRCADMNVDCVVTTSPLCHTALDIYQGKAESVSGRRIAIPVLHLEQLLAIAFGASVSEAGLDRHMVSTDGLMRKL
ncbi:MAG TPA: CoB--CoM heterodisulfide reductase iron-sulfur subunit B family protein [Burkholderiales bacterium]|nr:CoB--CoM heterodisulfide reductase iron-sulfur subunit B family protein [Burkholderiales bacterium]